jgi:hypothetical protein
VNDLILLVYNNVEVLNMARPSKPMAKNNNSKFTTRNNKQDIFSKMAKASKPKVKPAEDVIKPEAET